MMALIASPNLLETKMVDNGGSAFSGGQDSGAQEAVGIHFIQRSKIMVIEGNVAGLAGQIIPSNTIIYGSFTRLKLEFGLAILIYENAPV